MIRALLLVLATMAVLTMPARADEELDERFSKGVLVVVTGQRACYRFDVYLAITGEQRRRGLMFVRSLPTFTGMLFIHSRDDLHSIWMRNTLIPLDVIFARADGTVATNYRNATPQSERSMPASEPVRYALEINGGLADRLGIDENSYFVMDQID